MKKWTWHKALFGFAVLLTLMGGIMLVFGASWFGRDVRKNNHTKALIADFKLGIEKYYVNGHKYPFVADANGDFNVDDCWRELAPSTVELTAGLAPGSPGYCNKKCVECLVIPSDMLQTNSEGKVQVVDGWGHPFCMQWDYVHKKVMIWSAGPDGCYDISDDSVKGGHSSLWAKQADAKPQTAPEITPDILKFRIERDLSNY